MCKRGGGTRGGGGGRLASVGHGVMVGALFEPLPIGYFNTGMRFYKISTNIEAFIINITEWIPLIRHMIFNSKHFR